MPRRMLTGLATDVLTLTSSLGTVPSYVLDMKYDPASLKNPETSAAIAWYNTGLGSWQNAVLGNTGNNATSAEQNYQGSYAAFAATYGTTTSSYIGAYGVDMTNHEAWAVLNHVGDFAVPEPGTLALLAAGLIGLLVYAWRKRK